MISFKQLFSYGSAVVKFLMSGGKIVSETIYEARASICRGCDQNVNNVCQKCGCNLEDENGLVSKLLMPQEVCPLNKWCAYDHKGVPHLTEKYTTYQINTMLKSDGKHLYEDLDADQGPFGVPVELNRDPLNNVHKGFYGGGDITNIPNNQNLDNITHSMNINNDGCNCGG
jgi:hypothetical protein